MEIKINLIPDYKKREIIESKHLGSVLRFNLAMIFIGCIFFVFLMGIVWILELELQSIDNSSEGRGAVDNTMSVSDYEKFFKESNLAIADVYTIKKEQLYWSRVFLEISSLNGQGIEVQEISTKGYSMFISGKSENRDMLMSFKEKLEKSACFEGVELPLSNLTSRSDIAFQMDIRIKKDCLKKIDG